MPSSMLTKKVRPKQKRSCPLTVMTSKACILLLLVFLYSHVFVFGAPTYDWNADSKYGNNGYSQATYSRRCGRTREDAQCRCGDYCTPAGRVCRIRGESCFEHLDPSTCSGLSESSNNPGTSSYCFWRLFGANC
ncbi:hypothetical protein BDR26DRAFT_870326 [Obelidium mucronatum]|nr:hypothetical protein BDR26DRAFT_870326 [Obelidium mucronatum]